jgi:glycosyltransferase involved in cell wall biosynthesis
MAPLPISVCMISGAEAQRIRRALDSVAGLAREIVVVLNQEVDDGTDRLAAEYGARVLREPWKGHVAQKNSALGKATQPWVLCLDADEALTPELAESIRALFAAGEPVQAGYWLNRRTFYLGQWIWHAWYPEWRLRLARRSQAAWAGLDPHDKLEVADGPTARLTGDLLHYSFSDLDDHLRRVIRYARIMARSYAATGRRFHWHQLLLSPGVAFLRHLLLKQGWRDGWRGWLISGVCAVGVFAKYAYLLEIERGPQPPR